MHGLLGWGSQSGLLKQEEVMATVTIENTSNPGDKEYIEVNITAPNGRNYMAGKWQTWEPTQRYTCGVWDETGDIIIRVRPVAKKRGRSNG